MHGHVFVVQLKERLRLEDPEQGEHPERVPQRGGELGEDGLDVRGEGVAPQGSREHPLAVALDEAALVHGRGRDRAREARVSARAREDLAHRRRADGALKVLADNPTEVVVVHRAEADPEARGVGEPVEVLGAVPPRARGAPDDERDATSGEQL